MHEVLLAQMGCAYSMKIRDRYWFNKLALSEVMCISIAHPRAMQNTLLVSVSVAGFFFSIF